MLARERQLGPLGRSAQDPERRASAGVPIRGAGLSSGRACRGVEYGGEGAETMAVVKKDARDSSAGTRRASNTGPSGRSDRGVRDDKAVREAAAFYKRAVKRPDVRAILEDLAKV
jgi:hypothetical protein